MVVAEVSSELFATFTAAAPAFPPTTVHFELVEVEAAPCPRPPPGPAFGSPAFLPADFRPTSLGSLVFYVLCCHSSNIEQLCQALLLMHGSICKPYQPDTQRLMPSICRVCQWWLPFRFLFKRSSARWSVLVSLELFQFQRCLRWSCCRSCHQTQGLSFLLTRIG